MSRMLDKHDIDHLFDEDAQERTFMRTFIDEFEPEDWEFKSLEDEEKK